MPVRLPKVDQEGRVGSNQYVWDGSAWRRQLLLNLIDTADCEWATHNLTATTDYNVPSNENWLIVHAIVHPTVFGDGVWGTGWLEAWKGSSYSTVAYCQYGEFSDGRLAATIIPLTCPLLLRGGEKLRCVVYTISSGQELRFCWIYRKVTV